MNTPEQVELTCEIISAFSTSLGVGAAIAYYLKNILNISLISLAFILAIYFSIILILIIYFIQKLKEEKNETPKMDLRKLAVNISSFINWIIILFYVFSILIIFFS